MITIESYKSGTFEGETLEEVKEKIVETIALSSFDRIEIDSIDYHGEMLANHLLKETEMNIEMKIKKWRKVAEIESRGLTCAQQDSKEG